MCCCSRSWRQYICLLLLAASLWGSSKIYECSAEQKSPQELPSGEGLPSKHRIIVRYHVDKTAGGLVNQMLCHIGAFLLAIPLRAEILLPGALSRSTYNTKWWQQEWHTEPLQSLLSVDEIIRHWRKRGILIHQVKQKNKSNSAQNLSLSALLFHGGGLLWLQALSAAIAIYTFTGGEVSPKGWVVCRRCHSS